MTAEHWHLFPEQQGALASISKTSSDD